MIRASWAWASLANSAQSLTKFSDSPLFRSSRSPARMSLQACSPRTATFTFGAGTAMGCSIVITGHGSCEMHRLPGLDSSEAKSSITSHLVPRRLFFRKTMDRSRFRAPCSRCRCCRHRLNLKELKAACLRRKLPSQTTRLPTRTRRTIKCETMRKRKNEP